MAVQSLNTRGRGRVCPTAQKAVPAGDFVTLGANSPASPDAGLLRACQRFTKLHEEVAFICRTQPRGYGNLTRGKTAAIRALEEEIAITPADTAEGRRAKADAALLAQHQGGSVGAIGLSVLRELVSGYAVSERRA